MYVYMHVLCIWSISQMDTILWYRHNIICFSMLVTYICIGPEKQIVLWKYNIMLFITLPYVREVFLLGIVEFERSMLVSDVCEEVRGCHVDLSKLLCLFLIHLKFFQTLTVLNFLIIVWRAAFTILQVQYNMRWS